LAQRGRRRFISDGVPRRPIHRDAVLDWRIGDLTQYPAIRVTSEESSLGEPKLGQIIGRAVLRQFS
jgi:hypothetical protein